MAACVGVIHGRFQPLHIGHLEYLLAGKAKCALLVIGITNADPSQIKVEETNAERSDAAANPCRFYERYLMVEGAMLESGIPLASFRIVPFPISFPERLHHYVPRNAEYYVTIYDAWGESKLERLKALGLKTSVLWRRNNKVTTGTQIRELIATGGPWRDLVPKATADVIKQFGIDDRIRLQRPVDRHSDGSPTPEPGRDELMFHPPS